MRLLFGAVLGPAALAGGSGLNVAVVVNRLSPDSLALGNLYCERRHVPPQNLVRIDWAGSRIEWPLAHYQRVLAEPLAAELARRGLAGQIDFGLLAMDIPYRVTAWPDVNSTTAALFYGFKTNDVNDPGVCRLSPVGGSGYYASELALAPRPAVTNPPVYLAMMLTARSFADAARVLERGAGSDGAFPPQPVLLQRTSDDLRSVRSRAFDHAVFDARVHGVVPLITTNSDATLDLTNLLGLSTGLAQVGLGTNVFAPGAMADSLTSYGGFLFEETGQTNLLEFLRAGATGSYGTVAEPCNYPEKFPHPSVYFYQARGFTLAESYYQSVASPYEGLLVGEPLAAPFARPGQGAWVAFVPPDLNAGGKPPRPGLMGPAPDDIPVYAGATNLALAFTAADATRPLQQIDLFVDGVFAYSVTNLPPAEGNRLRVRINGTLFEDPVPAQATLASVAAHLAGVINARSNVTMVAARAYGDRIGLDSLDPARSGAEVALTASQLTGSAARLTTFIRAARPQFLDSTARGYRGYEVRGAAEAGDYLTLAVTKTNGELVSVSVTNPTPPVSAAQLTKELMSRINATAALQGADGVSAEDAAVFTTDSVDFRLYARSPGRPAAQVQVEARSSPWLTLRPGGRRTLDENVSDLYPRNHLYLTAGAATLDPVFPFDTRPYPDGDHTLTAVAYEGSSIRTQTQASQSVRVQNTPLLATLEFPPATSTVAVEAVLPFQVTANRSEIATIELFSTGGRVGAASGQASATFPVSGRDLGSGRHPFYAVVHAVDGARYRTGTITLRLVAEEAPIRVTISGVPGFLSWPATPERVYEVLSAGVLAGREQVEATLTATASGRLQWPLPDPHGVARFYRVRAPAVAAAPGGR